jgi:hypothetical protein
MLGRYSHHWECAQQAWILYPALSEQISSSQGWAASLIAKTWLTSWNIWEQQKCTLSSTCLRMTERMTVLWFALYRYGTTCQEVGLGNFICMCQYRGTVDDNAFDCPEIAFESPCFGSPCRGMVQLAKKKVLACAT